MGVWFRFRLTAALAPDDANAIRSLSGAYPVRRGVEVVAPRNCAWIVDNLLRTRGYKFMVDAPPEPRPIVSLDGIDKLRAFVPEFLLPHQRESLFTLGPLAAAHAHHAAGSGKSLVALAWALLEPGRTVFVTRAAARGTIAGEIKRYTTATFDVLIGLTHREVKPDVRFVIVGIETLPAHLKALRAYNPTSIVWDEIHKLSSPRRRIAVPLRDDEGKEGTHAQTSLDPNERTGIRYSYKDLENIASAAEKLSRHASVTRRIGTTATPIQDRLRNLWAQLDLVEPRAWGNFSTFAHRYCAARPGDFGGLDTSGRSGPEFLNELVARLSFNVHHVPYHVTHAHLPPKRRLVSYLSGDVMLAHTAALEREASKEAKEHHVTNRGALLYTKLASAAARKRPVVVERVLTHAHAAEDKKSGGKVTVFTGLRKDVERTFRDVSKAVEREKKDGFFRGVDVGLWMAHGGLSPARRDVIREEYMAHPGPAILIATGQSFGESVNLQDTDVALIAMLPFTPGAILQNEGRFTRQGQRRAVLMEYLVAEGTIDEHVAQILLNKLPAVERVSGEEALSNFSAQIGGTDDPQAILDTLWEKITAAEEAEESAA